MAGLCAEHQRGEQAIYVVDFKGPSFQEAGWQGLLAEHQRGAQAIYMGGPEGPRFQESRWQACALSTRGARRRSTWWTPRA